MGYIPGKGIGKHETGIAEPINEASYKGRVGLGYFLKGLETEDVQWELEEVRKRACSLWTCERIIVHGWI